MLMEEKNNMSFFLNFKTAFKNIFRNKTTSLGTIISISSTLFILGIILLVILNINNFVINSKLKFYNIQINFYNDTSQKQIDNIKSTLDENFDLKSITFVSKEKAMDNFKNRFGEDAYLFDDISNPLSDSLVIEFKSLDQIQEITNSLKNNQFIESIEYFKDELKLLEGLSAIISLVGLAIILLLFIITLFVIANTIKIAIFSRMREIEIMKYIGATNWYIRRPFIIEGIVIGVVGASIATTIVVSIYHQFCTFFANDNFSLLANNLIHPYYITILFIKIFLTIGIGIGVLGSLISLRKYLRV